jgi:hypothetical protein
MECWGRKVRFRRSGGPDQWRLQESAKKCQHSEDHQTIRLGTLTK